MYEIALFHFAQYFDILTDMKKDHYNVLAVYSLLHYSGREHFSGVVEEMSNTSNWHLSTIPPEKFRAQKKFVNERGDPFDGVILSMPGDGKTMGRIAMSRIPAVLVDIADRRISARRDAVSTVWTNNADVGRRAAQHLLSRGSYRSAGFVHEFGRPFFSDERMAAFRQAMRRGGCDTSVFDESENGDLLDGLRSWLRAFPKPAAVMAATDMRAADVINACAAEGIAVPSQVAVIGVDYDVSQHAKCGMSISSVILNSRMLGRMAVRELDFLLRHPKRKGRIHEVLIPAKDVFAGESTARSVSATHLVNIALEFIAANRERSITPADVAAHLGCSRRLAELRFSQVRGTTIHAAIGDARLGEVRRRITVGESVGEIVKAMHFRSANQLYQMYKRHFGRTLRQSHAATSPQ